MRALVRRSSDVNSSEVSDNFELEVFERLLADLGIISARDTERTVLVVFRALWDTGNDGVGSSQLSRISGINRLTCLHHLKRLENAGLAMRTETGRFRACSDSLSDIVHRFRQRKLEMLDELEQMVEEFEKMSEDFNQQVELHSRLKNDQKRLLR